MLRATVPTSLALCWVCAAPVLAQQDVRGSADHSLFPTRMPGYYISSYRVSEFEAAKINAPKGHIVVEGKVYRINYRRPRAVPHPGGLAIIRNYQNAVKSAGGEIVVDRTGLTVLKARSKDGAEVFVEILASQNPSAMMYSLMIVERAEMKQVITADAMRAALEKDGSIALSIEFEFGRAGIRPESLTTVEQIVELLKANPSLRLGVEGHTDDVGDAAGNQRLSEARAQAVVAAVVARGIDKSRLEPAGFGEDRPIASNTTEEGRARNRRVVLVKR